MCFSCQRIFSQCKPDLTADSSIESGLKFLLLVHINTPQVLDAEVIFICLDCVFGYRFSGTHVIVLSGTLKNHLGVP